MRQVLHNLGLALIVVLAAPLVLLFAIGHWLLNLGQTEEDDE